MPQNSSACPRDGLLTDDTLKNTEMATLTHDKTGGGGEGAWLKCSKCSKCGLKGGLEGGLEGCLEVSAVLRPAGASNKDCIGCIGFSGVACQVHMIPSFFGVMLS